VEGRRTCGDEPGLQNDGVLPELFFIGSDGGGEAYAFDLSRTDATVFEVPFVGLSTHARAIASSFELFLAT
jgi:hypothetical protein